MSINYKALEKKLRAIVEKRLEEGWFVDRGFTCLNSRLCLIGAIGVEKGAEDVQDPYDLRDAALPWLKSKGVDIRGRYDNDLELGFEGYAHHSSVSDVKLADIGARIRRDYCEWQG